MNQAELYGIWQRWMHRRDLVGDLDGVFSLATLRIRERVLHPLPDLEAATQADLDEFVDAFARMYVHSGLSYLHELAQDDEGAGREEQRFLQASADHHMSWSGENVTPVMVPAGNQDWESIYDGD